MTLLLQISAAHGPLECQLAVAKALRRLLQEARDGGVIASGLRSGAHSGRHFAEHDTPVMAAPKGFSIELDGTSLRVRSEAGRWGVEVPYYFMIWQLRNFTATSGMETQLLIVSTGAAKHPKVAGLSQATLMLISSPADDVAQFRAYWMELTGVDETMDKTDLGFRQLTTHKTHDPDADLHKELVFFTRSGRAFAVFYSGIGGAYEWNRPHFMDFVRAITPP